MPVFHLVFKRTGSQGGRNQPIHFVSCVGHPLQANTTKSATPVVIKQVELAFFQKNKRTKKETSDTLDNSQLSVLALAFL